MLDFIKGWSRRAALPPGSLVHVGRRRVQTPSATATYYNGQGRRVVENAGPDDVAPVADEVCWLRVRGLHDLELIRGLGQRLNLHPMLLEDVVEATQRPKVEEFADYLFVVLRLLRFDQQTAVISEEQLSLVLGRGWVATFEESDDTPLDLVAQRIAQRRGRIAEMGADYLAYAIIDVMIDSNFGVLEAFGESLDAIEDQVLANPSEASAKALYHFKGQIIHLRRVLWPLREVVNFIARGDSGFFSQPVWPFLRDVADHALHVLDAADAIREQATGLMELHLGALGNRTNEVMKVLTIMASIFIPLTFIAGVYGMNFEYMPELRLHYGYPAVLAAMAAVAAGLIIYFRHKKWL